MNITDAERLDFIEKQTDYLLRYHKRHWCFFPFTSYEHTVHRKLRDAIDAAIMKQREREIKDDL